ncbi:Stealth protein CR1, conserved region 1 [Microlunatus sagamiharensis]|uniref:Stealth protein CR1, conserved region 1 n=1 Tax=Microlunatus sagamiharensis TaxID=546874 RepID=A0A1H2N899_9ACTN|nr:stealth family protein [Microlunatus sagamiharensis]SDV01739.1 Stealth protein CR1, conserved region 1 [Microlunatus sagamiharensis]
MVTLLPQSALLSVVRRRLDRAAPPALVRHARLLAQGQSPPQRLLHDARASVARQLILPSLPPAAEGRTYVAVKTEGTSVPALVVDTFRCDEVWGDQAARVADAFVRHDVDHVFVSTDPHRRRVIAVPESQRDHAVRALAADLGASATQIAAVRGDELSRSRPLSARRPRLADALRVFQVLATRSGAFLSGAEMGCDVQFWREVGCEDELTESGETLDRKTLVGERTFDPLPETVEPSSVVERLVDRRPRPVAPELASPHLVQHDLPVDVVYTWVDGDDESWRARRDRALRETDATLHDLATNDSRYTSHDELRYSMRSLEMYAPWVRRVFLVTDDQVPPWLNRANPRLDVVDHRDLFRDRGRLPTFNSHAIESQLHHIEGLSENFLYLNDDIFFGRPVDPALFVLANGLSQIFFSSVKVGSGPLTAGDLPITSAAKNNRDVLQAEFGRTTLHKFQHAPYSLRRSVLHELEALLPEEMEVTASATFRSPSDLSVAASLGLAYGYLVGCSVPGTLRYLYADIARPDTPHRLAELLARRDRDVFCLNDHDSSALDTHSQSTLVQGFLESYFPLPSSFER